ncbi:DMT family transporter [Heliophilum fasciatum]|uniref:Small multidrug resistance pump n=1 Tax=Heliophilum fasciatum TaxID=35700 RepID=A0A4V6NRT1_9FIRM|nr:multidrug efflux SMR transporter [Heliophilum fasciatum]MCW2276873.1 small multidrug resistance pump [Heliophilum fasciatum]TCP68666.1 small multidrug resistance pump [Heliophilum fasciatum]
MHWLYLVLAIGFEVVGTTSMKYSNGFTKLIPSIAMGIFYILSLSMLTFSLKKIDVSIAYAIWSGVGTALIAVIGFFIFKEQISMIKIFAIGLIISGVVILNLAGGTHE